VNSMLKISEAASLALHAAAILAAGNGNGRNSTRSMAHRLGASEHHLAKVMQRLGRAGLVRSVRGPQGGFVLASAPADISLLQIYEAVDGPLRPAPCLLPHQVCGGDDCVLGGLVQSLNDQIEDYLERTTLADLAHVFPEREEQT